MLKQRLRGSGFTAVIYVVEHSEFIAGLRIAVGVVCTEILSYEV